MLLEGYFFDMKALTKRKSLKHISIGRPKIKNISRKTVTNGSINQVFDVLGHCGELYDSIQKIFLGMGKIFGNAI
jgi:hypothetical protein